MENIVPYKLENQPEKIGEGLYGCVYRNPDGTLTKRQKIRNPIPEKNTSVWRELRAYDWIDTILDKEMKKFFAVRFCHTIRLYPEYNFMPNWFKLRMDIINKNPDSVSTCEKEFVSHNFKKMSISNDFPYICDIVIQDKGREPVLKNEDPVNIKKFFFQAFSIINFMQNNNVIHSDIHSGNFLIQQSGDIALIDYGSFHLIDDEFYDMHKKEHIMIAHMTSIMIDTDNSCDVEESIEDATLITTLEQRITTALSIGDNWKFLESVCAKIGYDDPIVKATNAPHKHDLVVAILLNRTKVRYPEDFKRTMGWPKHVKLHSYVDADTLDFVFMNMDNIPAILQIFS
jgi:serine/threonine protein kinase